MIGLYLLAAHMVGDFVLQTRWQAEDKLNDYNLRARHVGAYLLPFAPIAAVYAQPIRGESRWLSAVAFLLWLAILHFAADSRRFHSTFGDCVGWRLVPQEHRLILWRAYEFLERRHATSLLSKDEAERSARSWPPPNPWTPIPILIDQTLHVCQLAVLGGIFLS